MNAGDAALVAAIAARRFEAIGEAYDCHAAALYRLALVVARDRSHAEDAVLGAFTELWSTCDEVDVQGPSLRAVLAEVVYARCRRTRPEVGSRRSSTPRRTHGTAFARLPQSQRELVALIVLGEQDLRQAARCTGHGEAAAAELLSAALHAARSAADLRERQGRPVRPRGPGEGALARARSAAATAEGSPKLRRRSV